MHTRLAFSEGFAKIFQRKELLTETNLLQLGEQKRKTTK
jgi:hypothetical protein